MHRWHDFFRVEDVLVPWAPGREAMEGAACRRMDFQAIDELLHRHFSFSWNDVDAMGVHKVHAFAVLGMYNAVFLVLGPLSSGCNGYVWEFPAGQTVFHVCNKDGIETVHKTGNLQGATQQYVSCARMCLQKAAASRRMHKRFLTVHNVIGKTSCTGSVAAL